MKAAMELERLAKEHKALLESKNKTEEEKKRRKAVQSKITKIRSQLPENLVLPPLQQAIPKSCAERQALSRAMKSNKEPNLRIRVLKKNSLRNWGPGNPPNPIPHHIPHSTLISFL